VPQRYFIGPTDLKINLMHMQFYEKTASRQNKRRLAKLEGVKHDLKNELPLLFQTFKYAYELYESEILNTPPLARARGFEASLLNSKMIQAVQKYFPDKWVFGKYKRFTLRTKGYIILFKKLNQKNRPMNIKTNSVNAISNQISLPLFNEDSYIEEPILFFGYKRDRFGNISEPKLVYLDEDKVRWAITSKDIEDNNYIINTPRKVQPASPQLKKGKDSDKKAG
tara:strand:- start:177 stop:848 length:672 start_codon:yes stop_codon:yes gene_type:complete